MNSDNHYIMKKSILFLLTLSVFAILFSVTVLAQASQADANRIISNIQNMQSNSNAGAFLIMGAMMIPIMIFGIVSFIAFIWSLINILTAENDNHWKILWVIICLFLGIIGVIIYVLVGKKERIAKSGITPVKEPVPEEKTKK